MLPGFWSKRNLTWFVTVWSKFDVICDWLFDQNDQNLMWFDFVIDWLDFPVLCPSLPLSMQLLRECYQVFELIKIWCDSWLFDQNEIWCDLWLIVWCDLWLFDRNLMWFVIVWSKFDVIYQIWCVYACVCASDCMLISWVTDEICLHCVWLAVWIYFKFGVCMHAYVLVIVCW